jgi:hypothetical protein
LASGTSTGTPGALSGGSVQIRTSIPSVNSPPAVFSAQVFQNPSSTSSYTVSYNNIVALNNMLVVYVTNSYTVAGAFTSTYGGVPMTLLQTNASASSNSHLFYLAGAPPSTNNLVINSAG